MKKIIFFLLLLITTFTLFANSILEKKSSDLIQKLTEDGLTRLALLEVDYFLKKFPNSNQKEKISFQKAQILTKIMQYQASSKILSKLQDHSSEFYKESFFLQAKNYFRQQKLLESLIFFQNTKNNNQDQQYSNFFYQMAIYLFLENLSTAKQLLENIIIKEQYPREKEFLQTLVWHPQKEIEKVWQKTNFNELEKFLFTLISAELYNQEKNIDAALENLFSFYLEEIKSPLISSLLNFFIAKNLYQKTTKEPSSDSLNLAKKFFLQHQQTKFSPLPQSYLYLGNIYAREKKYQLAYQQYNYLLPYVNYTQLFSFVFNFVEISKFLNAPQTAKEILEKTMNNTVEVDKIKILAAKLIGIYLSLGCCEKALFLQNSFKDNTQNLEIGNCYFIKQNYQKAKILLLQTPLTKDTMLKTMSLLAAIFAIEKNEQGLLDYFEKIKPLLNNNFLPLQQSKLNYYYYLENWIAYAKDFEALQNNPAFVPTTKEQKKLAIAYKKTNQKTKLQLLHLKILKTLTSKKEKLELAETLITDYQKQKKYSQIAMIYEVLLADLATQNKPKIELLIAKNYLKAKNITKAQKWFQIVAYRKNTKIFSNYAVFRSEALYFLAERYSAQKKYKSNIAILAPELKKITTKNKWYKKINFSIAGAYSNLQQWNKALKHYKIVAQEKDTKEGKIAHNNSLKIKKFLKEQKKSQPQ